MSWLYRVQFEVEDKTFKPDKKCDENGIKTTSKSIIKDEFIVADSFREVYNNVKIQDDETFELVMIKKEVPVLSVIPPNRDEEHD